MSKKHWGRLLIVLFLLAALPVMTAVMAQGQEPVKEIPAESVMPAGPADWGEIGDTAPWRPTNVDGTRSDVNNQCAVIGDDSLVVENEMSRG